MTMLRRMRNQNGFSLPEMLVAIVISSVVGMVIMKTFNANNYLFAGEKTSSRTISNARLLADELTRSIRMLGLNPTEKDGAVFWLKQCNGGVGDSFASAPITNDTSIYFTRDWNENGTLDKNAYEMVGVKWVNTAANPNTLQVANIDPTTGAISSWSNKWTNVTAFYVDYIYTDSSGNATHSETHGIGYPTGSVNSAVITTTAGVGFPDNTVATRSFDLVEGIIITVTVQSDKPHKLTGQYIAETVQSTILLRNKYY